MKRNGDRSDKCFGSLTAQVQRFATPNAADAVGSHGGGQGRSLRTDIHNWKQAQTFPTPDTQCHRDGSKRRSAAYGRHGVSLHHYIDMFPTPRAGKASSENLEAWEKRKAEGKVSTPPLGLAVKMFPTPTASDDRAQGPNSIQKNLARHVRDYPTPRSSDHKSGRVSEETLARNSRPLNEVVTNFATPQSRDYKSSRGKDDRWDNPNRSRNLNDQIHHLENYPTPNVSDATRGSGSTGRSGGPNLRTVAEGMLNPDWVEWLMGWPVGWTSLEPMPRENWDAWIDGMVTGEWWLSEPEGIPRVSTGVPKRVARIKALGNGWVPACAVVAWELLTEGGAN